MTDLPTLPASTPADPRDLRIASDNRADTATLARLTHGRADFTRRAAAGLLLDLRPHTFGELSAVDRSGKVIPMREELDTVTAIRRHVRAA